MSLYPNRREAGRILTQHLEAYRGRPDVVVLALARGGVPIGFEVAESLGVPLDVLLVSEVNVPGDERRRIATIASGGVGIFDPAAIDAYDLPFTVVDDAMAIARRALDEQERLYRRGRPATNIAGQTVILVYDGLVTGATMLAAIATLRLRRPRAIVVAVPVGSPEGCAAVMRAVDACVCPATPHTYFRTSIWYDDFERVTDAEVGAFLESAATATRVMSAPARNAEPPELCAIGGRLT